MYQIHYYESLFESIEAKAKVQFYTRYCVAYTDQEISRYYLSLLPKAWYVRPQMYPTHLTIVRLDKEDVITEQDNWGKRNNEEITFYYLPKVRTDSIYYWLDCYSKDICDIRESLGMARYRTGFDCFHLTIGNTKDELSAPLDSRHV